MIRILLGGLIIAHGLVTAAIWASPAREGEPFRAAHSWVLGEARSLAMALALVAALGFVLAGTGFLAHQAWWGAFGVGAVRSAGPSAIRPPCGRAGGLAGEEATAL
jgi:hypothetical protein